MGEDCIIILCTINNQNADVPIVIKQGAKWVDIKWVKACFITLYHMQL